MKNEIMRAALLEISDARWAELRLIWKLYYKTIKKQIDNPAQPPDLFLLDSYIEGVKASGDAGDGLFVQIVSAFRTAILEATERAETRAEALMAATHPEDSNDDPFKDI